MKAKTSGVLSEVFVREGQAVKRGALLARIDNPTLAFELKRGQVDRSAATAQSAGRAPQIEALRGQGRATAAEIGAARAELQRLEQLTVAGAATSAELDRARATLAQLEGMLAANAAQQRALRIDLTANVARQDATVAVLSARLPDTEVRAPMDGVVLHKIADVSEVVSVNQPLFRIGDTLAIQKTLSSSLPSASTWRALGVRHRRSLGRMRSVLSAETRRESDIADRAPAS